MLTILAEILCHSEDDFKIVLASFKTIRPLVLQEPGCHGYDVHIDAAAESAMQSKVPYFIVMYEKWETVQDLERYMQSANMQAALGAVSKVLVRILEQV
ncbi:MAG: antibiotic biosynthesis monooxygenase family protein [Acinetobacter sp.]